MGAILFFPSVVRGYSVADGRTLTKEERETMKRTLWSLAAVFAVAAVLACPALAADSAAPAPSGEKLIAAAIELVGPPAGTPANPIIKAGDQIVCMGDSITAGGGYLRDMDAVFAQQFPDLKLPKIINAGVSGHKAENCIARFQKDVLDKKPNVLTLNIGINDVWHRLKAPHDPNVLATYKENVGKMIDQAQAAGIKVILLTPTVIQEDAAAEGQKRLALYVNAMKEIAAEKKCGFVDLHQMFLDALGKKPADFKGNWLTGDGVHMKPLGNAIMALAALRGMGVPDFKSAATVIMPPPPRQPRKPQPKN